MSFLLPLPVVFLVLVVVERIRNLVARMFLLPHHPCHHFHFVAERISFLEETRNFFSVVWNFLLPLPVLFGYVFLVVVVVLFERIRNLVVRTFLLPHHFHYCFVVVVRIILEETRNFFYVVMNFFLL